MRQFFRILLAITLGIVSCGLVLLTLMVTRNCWLLLGQLYVSNYAVFNLMDKGLVLLGGIVGLGLLVYSLEMYTSAETPIALSHQFLRLTAPVIWVLGTCHAIMALATFRLGPGNASAFLLPTAELLLGTALYCLDRKYVNTAALIEARGLN